MRGLPSTGSASLYLQYNMIWKKVNPQSPAGGFSFAGEALSAPCGGTFPLGGGRQFLTLPNSTKRAIISPAHGYALALPVFGRREAPSSGGGRTSFIKPPLSRGEVVHMVTHSELILIGQLIVSVLTLFVHIYNNKKK